jgi:branched-chain amino acid transport system substrate-binding protein
MQFEDLRIAREEKGERKMKNATKRLVLIILVALMAVATIVGVAGCSSSSTTTSTTAQTSTTAANAVVAKEWDLPLLSVLTGPVAFAGLPGKWGAEYAVNEINAAGGVRGVPIKLTAYDTALDNAKAVAMMAKAIPGSLIVLGPFDGRGSEAVSQQVKDNKILSINSNTALTTLASSAPYSIAYMQDSAIANVLAAKKWFELQPGIKSVAMFYDPSDPAGKDTIDKFQAQIGATGVKVVPIEIAGTTQLDFGPAVLKAMNAKVDGYFSSYLSSNHIAIAKELFNRGITQGTEIIGGMAADGSDLFTTGKGFLENSYLWENINPTDTSAKWQTLVTAYKKDFSGQTPINPVVGFYDAVYAFKTAVEALNITGDPAKLVQERQAIDDYLYNSKPMQGLQFQYQYVQGEKVAQQFLLQIKNNAFVLVSTLNR